MRRIQRGGIGMGVVYCGKAQNKKVCEKHSHNVWEAILRISGESTFYIDEEQYHIKPGDIIILPPNTVHEDVSEENCQDVFVRVDTMEFHEVMIVKDYDESVAYLMQHLHRVYIAKESNYQEICNCLWQTIYQYLKKNMEVDYKYHFVRKLKEILDANITNCDFNISTVIRSMGYQPDYVRKCFLEEVGMTPTRYLMSLKMAQAREILMIEHSISVEETAFRCGFRDNFYFSRVFKKHTGMSPLQYRRNAVENTILPM